MTTVTEVKKPPTEAAKDRKQRKNMKARAAILSIRPLSETSCLVWGGEHEHVVTFEGGLIKCDCQGWVTARNHNCSHVHKYRLVYGDLKK